MTTGETSSAQTLNAPINVASERYNRLWKVAGARYGWMAIVGLVAAVALLTAGLFISETRETASFWTLGICAFTYCQHQLRRAYAQNEALGELLKRLEQRMTRIEKATLPDR